MRESIYIAVVVHIYCLFLCFDLCLRACLLSVIVCLCVPTFVCVAFYTKSNAERACGLCVYVSPAPLPRLSRTQTLIVTFLRVHHSNPGRDLFTCTALKP